MKFMNDYDIFQAARRYGNGETPNRYKAALIVGQLADWANRNSDGWAYWPKPARAASKLMGYIESTAYPEYERRQHEDMTDEELTVALRPIKTFLTKHGVDSDTKREILEPDNG